MTNPANHPGLHAKCRCGHALVKHLAKSPHACLHEYAIWARDPYVVPPDWPLFDNHCHGFEDYPEFPPHPNRRTP